MPINHPKRGSHPYYHYRDRHYSQKTRRKKWILFAVPFGLAAICMYWYIQPLDTISSKPSVLSVQKTTDVTISWPATSQAAIGSVDQGVLAAKPSQTPKPTASTAKLITALTILKHKPLALKEQGPSITISDADIAIYDQYYAKNGSLAKVAVGQTLSEYQMLQGILLPSANNYADTLAIWAFGSLEKYRQAAQQLVDELDMTQTTIGSDASGFSPDTTSTTQDLTKLAIAAMENEIVAEIVRQDQVDLPVAGVKQNTNWLLGADGVIGLKTGNTDEAGGVYIFASLYELDNKHSTIIVGAVQGEASVLTAMHQARLLIAQAKPNFVLQDVVKKGQTIATYSSPWSKEVHAVAADDVQSLTWKAKVAKPKIILKNIEAPMKAGSVVGKIKIGSDSTDIVLKDSLDVPSWHWRVLRWL